LDRPGVSLVASIVVHVLVVGAIAAALLYGPAPVRPETPIAVPVQIVSDTLVVGGAPEEVVEDVPSDEPASGAEVESIPDPTPPEPTPPRTVTPRPAPPRPQPPPTPQPRPRRPPSPGLNLDELAGPRRPDSRPNPGPRTPPGPTGPAQQTSGPAITAMFEQVYPNWNVFVVCDMPGGDQLRIQFDVTLSPSGRITDGPTLVGGQGNEVRRAAIDGAVRALRATAPFDVPPGFTGGSYRATFLTERACRGR
jgi:outer membrane biosynthesis protein TonB